VSSTTASDTNLIINTTYDKTDISFQDALDGQLYNLYFLTVNITDTNGNAINGASVNISSDNNRAANTVNNIVSTTNSLGLTEQYNLTEFLANSTFATELYLNFNNYSINISAPGFVTQTDTQLNLTRSQILVIQLTDNTAPNTTITQPLANANILGNFLINVSINDSISNIDFVNLTIYNNTGNVTDLILMTRSSGTITNGYWNATFNSASLPDGNYNLSINATDAAGNTNISSNLSILIDNTAPTVAILQPVINANVTANFTLNFSFADLNSIDQCWYNVGNGNNISLPNCDNTTANTTDGVKTLILYVNDTAGNENSSNVTFRVWGLIIDSDQSLSAGTHNTSSVLVTNGATWTWLGNTGTGIGVNYTMSNLTIMSGATISANEEGFTGGSGDCCTGNGPGGGGKSSLGKGGGGGYGGHGGSGGGIGGKSYGSVTAPTDIGSGGGGGWSSANGGDGGGAIFLNITDTLNIIGNITANGETGDEDSLAGAGGGSGGSIYMRTATITGTGNIIANGGEGGDDGSSDGGGGAGGRIAIYHTTNTYTGNIQATGGSRGGTTSDSSFRQHGGAGTIYIKPDSADPILIIDNNNLRAASQSTNITSTINVNISGGADTFTSSGLNITVTNINITTANLTTQSQSTFTTTNMKLDASAITNQGNLTLTTLQSITPISTTQ